MFQLLPSFYVMFKKRFVGALIHLNCSFFTVCSSFHQFDTNECDASQLIFGALALAASATVAPFCAIFCSFFCLFFCFSFLQSKLLLHAGVNRPGDASVCDPQPGRVPLCSCSGGQRQQRALAVVSTDSGVSRLALFTSYPMSCSDRFVYNLLTELERVKKIHNVIQKPIAKAAFCSKTFNV